MVNGGQQYDNNEISFLVHDNKERPPSTEARPIVKRNWFPCIDLIGLNNFDNQIGFS